jgi:hypothetical protein
VVTASSSVIVAGTTFSLSTSGTAPNGGPATKRWVDAYIRITPDGLNPVGEAHTFNVAFTALPGDATPVTFNSIAFQLASSTLSQGVQYDVVSETCSDKTKWGSSSDAQTKAETRTCAVVINSSAVGTIKASAEGSVTMGADQDPDKVGATVVRKTDGTGRNSHPATKVYYQPAGCTPGFWKQPQHFGYWHDSPYRPVDPRSALSSAFSAFDGQGGYAKDLTMIAALDLENSTGVGQLLRHGVAALLNAYSKGVLYGFHDDPQAIKDAVNAALAGGGQSEIDALHRKLEQYNQLGCTLSGQKFW